jgi:hypothetical protein
VGHIASCAEWDWNAECNRRVGRPRRRCEGSITLDLKGIGLGRCVVDVCF